MHILIRLRYNYLFFKKENMILKKINGYNFHHVNIHEDEKMDLYQKINYFFPMQN